MANSTIDYYFVVLFDWSYMNDKPFSVCNKIILGESGISSDWLTKKLRDSHRKIKMDIQLSGISRNCSIFCKIEKG